MPIGFFLRVGDSEAKEETACTATAVFDKVPTKEDTKRTVVVLAPPAKAVEKLILALTATKALWQWKELMTVNLFQTFSQSLFDAVFAFERIVLKF